MRQLLVIAGLARRESQRKKALLLGIVLSLLFLLIFGLGLHYLQKELPASVIFSSQFLFLGLYMASFLTAIISALLGVGAVSGELESGTGFALLSRPLSRSTFMLGKFLGYCQMVLPLAAVLFSGVTGLVAWLTPFPLKGVLPALLSFLLIPLSLLAVAMLGSIYLPTLGNGIFILLLYGSTTIGGMLEQFGALANSRSLINIGIITSLLLPTDSAYRLAIVYSTSGYTGTRNLLATMGPFGAVSLPSPWMVAYILFYITALLVLANYGFSRKDL
jgi:ABC-type transport system involved in multi-copper enzyme maturation permease subunit